jgi:hypothetical protein
MPSLMRRRGRAARQDQAGRVVPAPDGPVPVPRSSDPAGLPQEQAGPSPVPPGPQQAGPPPGPPGPQQAGPSPAPGEQPSAHGGPDPEVQPGGWPAPLQFLWGITGDPVRLNRLIYLICMCALAGAIFIGAAAGIVYLVLMHAAVTPKVGITLGSSLAIALGSVTIRRVLSRRRDGK